MPAVLLVATLLAIAARGPAAEDDSRRALDDLQKRNLSLEELVRQQQLVIEALNRRVTALEQVGGKRPDDNDLAEKAAPPAPATPSPAAHSGGGLHLGKVHFSGEGGVAFFHSGSHGQFPHSEFRVDEAKLFVESPVWGSVYFFTELNLATRESDELELKVGELYLDWENVFGLQESGRAFNLRLGRMDVPFGEEYLTRDAIDNPLISHSLTDFWGVDEGLEVYGSLGKFSYVMAVQNGGVPVAKDFTGDKAVVGRLAWDPTHWLHLGVSAMRTGDLDTGEDKLSELWFGGGWFRSIGGPGTTKFHANLIEGDVAVRWSGGQLKAFGGAADYDDNDPAQSNARSMYYYAVEGRQQLTRKLYVAGRFSQIFADEGYPLTGHGNMQEYFFNYSPDALTTEIWRLSFGLGYRFNDHFLIKSEYALERGKTVGGDERDHEDLFAAEAAFRF